MLTHVQFNTKHYSEHYCNDSSVSTEVVPADLLVQQSYGLRVQDHIVGSVSPVM